MNKKNIFYCVGIIIIFLIVFLLIACNKTNNNIKTKNLTATVLAKSNDKLTIQDNKNIIYTFNATNLSDEMEPEIGSNIAIKYTGLLDKSIELQSSSVISYTTSPVSQDEDGIPTNLLDDGIFSNFYILANNKLKTLSLDEKIGQLLLVRYPETNAKEALKKYKFAGYIFFEKDFKDKTKAEVQNMIKELQDAANIPLLTAVDEEGGRVVRVSSNPNLASSKFKSPQELYKDGGFDLISRDTIEKSAVLKNLGLNLNLAPVVDVSTDPDDYMYDRTLGENTKLTSTYAETVIESSKGTDVSYTSKHFPGYGNNDDTHTGITTDNRSLEDIKENDLPPFKAGINKGAESVLVSHNIITNLDDKNPASLSASVHNLLRNDMNFTGIAITDDLDMKALDNIDNKVVKAILAGNDLIITTDYEESIKQINNALEDGTITEALIDKLAFRALAWKYYKGLMFEYQK